MRFAASQATPPSWGKSWQNACSATVHARFWTAPMPCWPSLPDPDITVFVSRNAVEFGIAYAGGELAAIGPATAAAIRDAGSAVSICPASGFDSEHLLREPAFSDMAGKTVRIIRGNPGREKLATELRAVNLRTAIATVR